ncbi:MAG: bifunctional 5,10-methylene-tetrahydrofolate dehydrogenase/5,10-methylene-tetrahydrofolate cyclohydrolase [Candidatus Eremiobacter antarcticus]|nr:bifunctional 5,10-methylenetetrahydrofolate dehydrogenase/5,10-methenyltetrahydrofolate cyclohydrolase [Candidatus Eremiobacteraeota bacterium]MBC5807639.1 bifunctional 5,10-methylenetetrahydrofolate dehydrogenase/5,10-methenyltetrahydrofolate cyclohydrolase [Candidatus Eremiobacteraeota bacterium]PZR61312.1 MAG: bifunctional 5,10-methylene-tetrahydrofolate dehydrogenase/5,10-methylene-tetrahydrofolate cyclohydrolase [Candidatus Eremiobacter sp. RRmetagenome_bin22]
MADAVILDGRAIAGVIRSDVSVRVAALRARGTPPTCAIVLLENDEAGRLYANSIVKAGDAVGIDVEMRRLPAASTTDDVLLALAAVVDDARVQAIIVQRPLPSHLDAERICEEIDPRKDVDGAHPYNQGLLMAGESFLVPATAAAVMEILKQPQVPSLDGARAVVIGRSSVVGRPVALLLTAANATVTICHSHTKHLDAVCHEAEVLVAAVGRPRFVTAAMVARGAVVIDVGTNFVDGRFVGDVDAESVSKVASALSPVPGGVGPVTTAVLLRNIVEVSERAAPRTPA